MTTSKSQVQLFCDGACLGNPGPGGWAYLLRTKSKTQKKHEKTASGSALLTTNNRMELQAAIEGLRALKKPCEVKIYSDSQYVIKGMREWSPQWIARGWKTASNKIVSNVDLWQELIAVSEQHDIEWHWVKGHSGHAENEQVDLLARTAAEEIAATVRA